MSKSESNHSLDDPFADTALESLPDVGRVLDLKTAEMLLLWASRSWVWAVIKYGDAGKQYIHGLRQGACGEAAKPLNCLLNIIGSVCTRNIQIHKPCCTNMSDDEKRLLYALAAQQTGRTLEVFDILSQILPPSAIRIALVHADAVALCFAQAGLFLPDRTWQLKELSLTHQLRAPQASKTRVRYFLH